MSASQLSSLLRLVLLTADVVLIGVFAVVGAAADGAVLLEAGALGRDARTSSGLEDLFGEDLGGDGRETGDATLEVVSAVILVSARFLKQRWRGMRQCGDVLPIAPHVTLLKIAIPESYLAGVACVWVGRGRVLECGRWLRGSITAAIDGGHDLFS